MRAERHQHTIARPDINLIATVALSRENDRPIFALRPLPHTFSDLHCGHPLACGCRMTNSILGSINRFWLEINANAWRYCPETVRFRVNAAYESLSTDLRELPSEQSDADFGRGWREGHEAGRIAGWAQRDREAQRELALKNDQIQALMTMVESYRMRESDHDPAPSAGGDVQALPQQIALTIGEPRSPVH